VLDLVVGHVVDHPDRRGGGRRDEAGTQIAGRVAEILGDRLGEQLA
jgi:hypothetical protein